MDYIRIANGVSDPLGLLRRGIGRQCIGCKIFYAISFFIRRDRSAGYRADERENDLVLLGFAVYSGKPGTRDI